MSQYAQRALVLAAAAIAVVMIVPPLSPLRSKPVRRPSRVALAGAALLAPRVTARPRGPAVAARGVLMTGWTAGGEGFDGIVGMIGRTELNAVVLDVKDENGEVSWLPTSPRALMLGSGRAKMADPRGRVRALKRRGIYVIGRIVTFKDPILASARPDLAVAHRRGGVWKDRTGGGWGDPYAPEVWDYNLELAVEAIGVGFDEIQFDYVRFPSDGDIGRMWFPHADERGAPELIRDFLARARAELSPLGAWLSADVFGLTTLASDDMGIGQRIELVAQEVDYLSLMLYPSHYNKPEYDIRDPEREPYRTISVSLADARRRIAGTRARLRPWLQDFSLRVHYSPIEVRAQIRAAEDAGVHQWLLWNAKNRYSEDALRPEGAKPSD